jgi:hypothetical protein
MQTKSNAEKNITPTITCTAPWRLTKIKALADYKLEAEFIDGTRGKIDMKSLIMGKNAGVFAKLININVFNQVHLEYGVITWTGEIDLAPDTMYAEIKQHGVWIVR